MASGSVRGLTHLKEKDEEINEYIFIRETAKKLSPGPVVRLPVSGAASGKVMSEFQDYMGNRRIARAGDIGVPGAAEVIYIGLDCYRYRGQKEKREDLLPSGIRRECGEICGGHPVKLYEKKLDAKVYGAGYQKRHFDLGARLPVVGFYLCAEPDRINPD